MQRTIWLAAISLLMALVSVGQQEKVRPSSDFLSEMIVRISTEYAFQPNVIYLTVNGFDAKLDLYYQRNSKMRAPTVVYFHGGGWSGGSKESYQLEVLPFLAMGFSVVNVEYRTTSVALAPAAVEDCRCALKWVVQNARKYNFDINKLVVTGRSAGGHLALMTGMQPSSAGFDKNCPGGEEPKVAAIINRYGIVDVNDLIGGANLQTYAVNWIGSQSNGNDIAKRVSPLTYVRRGLPPILTIHGDKDKTVPHSHALRLHKALDAAGVSNQLVTINGGGHGGFTPADNLKVYASVEMFLRLHKLLE